MIEISYTFNHFDIMALESPKLMQNSVFSYLRSATHVHPEKEVSKFEFYNSNSIFR